MYVSEIRYPGTALDGLTEKDASDVENLCRHIVDGLEEAAVALASFPEARANMRPAQRETDAISSEDRDKIAATRRSAQEAGASAEDVGAMYYDGEQAIKRELWRQGRWPDLYMRKRPFMFARDFVLGLDQVAKGLRALNKLPCSPPAIDQLMTQWENAFPDLKDVRDSEQHGEERARMLEHGRPIVTPFFHQGNLADKNEYIWTKADGDTGTVEVSETTLASAQAIVQSVLEAFTWIGAPRWVP